MAELTFAKQRARDKERILAITPSEVDPRPDVQGVLLSDQITFYAESEHMIQPFDREYLKPAAYELRVGDECFISGQHLMLDASGKREKTDRVVIPPFEVAVIKTHEILRIPRYMIARWDIRVGHAYSGLLWVGAPQVDPGWVGYLHCPIYNLSDKPVSLKTGDPLAVMDFTKTTQFSREAQDIVIYPKPKRFFIEDYGIEHFRSALYTRAGQKLPEIEQRVGGLDNKLTLFTGTLFTVFAIFLAILALDPQQERWLASSWLGAITFALSIAAFGMACIGQTYWALSRSFFDQYGAFISKMARRHHKYLDRTWFVAFTTILMGATLIAVSAYSLFPASGWEARTPTELGPRSVELVTSRAFEQVAARLGQLEQTVSELRRAAAAGATPDAVPQGVQER